MDPGFSWSDHVEWLVEAHGSLSAVAERLSALRGYEGEPWSVPVPGEGMCRGHVIQKNTAVMRLSWRARPQ